MNIPKVTIVIINWNGKHFLKKCLESIEQNTCYQNHEIVVVDNNSIDGSIDYIKQNHPLVKLIKNNKNQGFARANNTAIKATNGEYLFFLNNDTEVIRGWIETSINLAESDRNIGIVGSKIYFMNMKPQFLGGRRIHQYGIKAFPGIRKLFLLWALKHDKVLSIRYIQGSAFLVKREVFNKIGLFDEGFFVYGEEGDLCCRTRSNGYKILYTPLSKIKHLKSGTSKNDNVLSYFNRIKSDQRFILLNLSFLRIYLHVIIGIPLALIDATIHNRLSTLKKAYFENFKNLNEIKIKKSQRRTWII